MTDAAQQPRKLYKVLVDGKSCYGGTLAWSLPSDGAPGDWHRVDGQLSMCNRGIHLTSDPASWWVNGCRVYEAEAEEIAGVDGDSKTLCRGARLMRELTDAIELQSLRIYTSGSHQISSGKIVASGSASVRASGSASVRAYGSASVVAYGSASVEASDSASVRASDSASVRAYGSASVRASGSASVRAYGSASVVAYGSASVSMASGQATLVVFSGDISKIDLRDNAVIIDRRGDRPIVTIAGEKPGKKPRKARKAKP